MTAEPARHDEEVVARQIGRPPRRPWSVGSRCVHGFPSTIVSPPLLADGSPFPAHVWLTCPWLAEKAAQRESAGATGAYARLAAEDAEFARRLRDADAVLRGRREAAGSDGGLLGDVGIAGQRDPLGVKCLHAHLALTLIGIDDPIGADLLGAGGESCDDGRCSKLVCADAVGG